MNAKMQYKGGIWIRQTDMEHEVTNEHKTYTACSWLMCHVGGTVQIVSTYPASPGGDQPCVPAAWLAERLLLAGNIESNQGPKPTLKTLSHTRTQPPHTPSTLAHQSNPLKPSHSQVHSPPKTPTSIQDPYFLSASPHTHSLHSRPNTTYTSRLSPHIPITQTSIRRPPQLHPPQLLTSPHPHTKQTNTER